MRMSDWSSDVCSSDLIHDLRLEHGSRTAQIDHLLINRWMDVYVLETKHFHAGIKITEDGEFLRWNNYQKTYEGMASPLEQNERHIQVLKDVRADRKSVGKGKSVSVRVDIGGHRRIKKKTTINITRNVY